MRRDSHGSRAADGVAEQRLDSDGAQAATEPVGPRNRMLRLRACHDAVSASGDCRTSVPR